MSGIGFLDFLNEHDGIAWDLDGTLVNGRFSEEFCEYIEAHPEKKHHFITFRDPEWAGEIVRELEGCVSPDNIAGIHAMPVKLFNEQEYVAFRNPAGAPEFINFKGKTAAELGCTVMVDDLVTLVRPGCVANNVKFVDANAPYGYS